jgi:hypothetical protein
MSPFFPSPSILTDKEKSPIFIFSFAMEKFYASQNYFLDLNQIY